MRCRSVRRWNGTMPGRRSSRRTARTRPKRCRSADRRTRPQRGPAPFQGLAGVAAGGRPQRIGAGGAPAPALSRTSIPHPFSHYPGANPMNSLPIGHEFDRLVGQLPSPPNPPRHSAPRRGKSFKYHIFCATCSASCGGDRADRPNTGAGQAIGAASLLSIRSTPSRHPSDWLPVNPLMARLP